MADKEKQEKADGKVKKPFSVRFAIFMLLVTGAVFLPVTVIILVCMIPTMVAAVVDRHAEKTAWLTVGAMNLAGTVPIIFNLWDMGHTLSASLQIITQPETIMIYYGAALAGWIIYNNITPFVASVIVGKNMQRLKSIDKRQRDLIKKWGKEVTSG